MNNKIIGESRQSRERVHFYPSQYLTLNFKMLKWLLVRSPLTSHLSPLTCIWRTGAWRTRCRLYVEARPRREGGRWGCSLSSRSPASVSEAAQGQYEGSGYTTGPATLSDQPGSTPTTTVRKAFSPIHLHWSPTWQGVKGSTWDCSMFDDSKSAVNCSFDGWLGLPMCSHCL